MKRAMIAHFAKDETDLEIRRLVMERKQAATEGFGDFSLAVACLVARLSRPMDDGELVEILRQNMSSKLQTCLLMHPTPNADFLKAACRKFERLWETQAESAKDRRITKRMAELGFNEVSPQVEELNHHHSGQVGKEAPSTEHFSTSADVTYDVSALAHSKPVNRTEFAIC